jgi:hypothetical protein
MIFQQVKGNEKNRKGYSNRVKENRIITKDIFKGGKETSSNKGYYKLNKIKRAE